MNTRLLALSLSLSAILTGCIDDKYDLSDIDTTAEVKINSLTLPINMGEVTLDNVIDLDQGSKLIIEDGMYVFVSDGTFHSDDISVPAIRINAPSIEPMHDMIYIGASAPGSFTYPITSSYATFDYTDGNVSQHILAVDEVKTQLSMAIDISVEELKGAIRALNFTNVDIVMPKGLTMTTSDGTYNPETGILHIASKYATGDKLTIEARISAIDVAKSGATFSPDTHNFQFSGRMHIASGQLTINTDDLIGIASLPQSLTLTTAFQFSNLEVTKFSGRIDYALDDIAINSIDLSDIPDIINQSGTDLTIANPQIYLSINNPVGNYGLNPQTGLEITPVRDGYPGRTFSLDNGFFTIGSEKGNAQYLYCISPSVPQKYYAGFEDAEHVPFSTMGSILSGNGLPQTINVTVADAGIKNRQVSDFDLSTNLGSLEGTYKFYAPLALGAGSKIVYSDTQDGWNDDDIDKMVLKEIAITASVTNSTPFDISLTGYPIDVNGNRIGNVSIEGADIAKGSTDATITIKTTGEITHLDGFTFTATLLAPSATEVIKPTDKISLKNLKVTVSGSYATEL